MIKRPIPNDAPRVVLRVVTSNSLNPRGCSADPALAAMASSESRKRKREDDPPRVTFTTPNRTFERLLKGEWKVLAPVKRITFLTSTSSSIESSLESLRAAVVRKLDLGGAALLGFSQVRDGKQIDLEDGMHSPLYWRLTARSNRSKRTILRLSNLTLRLME